MQNMRIAKTVSKASFPQMKMANRLTMVFFAILATACSVEVPETKLGAAKTDTATATSTATATGRETDAGQATDQPPAATDDSAHAKAKTKVTVVVETEAEAGADGDVDEPRTNQGQTEDSVDQPAASEHALYRPGGVDFDEAVAQAPAGYRLATHEEILAVREAGKFDDVQMAVGNIWSATQADADSAMVVYLGSAAVRTENKRELHGALYVHGDAQ